MSTIEINILVAADPTENVHSHIKADGIEVWEVGLMLDRAISDLQAERAALPASHLLATIGTPQ